MCRLRAEASGLSRSLASTQGGYAEGMGLKLMIYDRTCTRSGRLPIGLTHSWVAGALLYRAAGNLDAWSGASSWAEALAWLGRGVDPIDEIQFWGHGNWGLARIAGDTLNADALKPGHPHHGALERIRDRMAPTSQWWFRTCDTLGSDRGHDFARRWTDFFGQPIAGFTHIIGPWQSGLHRLHPGATPHWDASEGIAEGSAAAPRRSTWSKPGMVNTISCLHSHVPEGW